MSFFTLKEALDPTDPERLRTRLRTSPYPSEADHLAAFDQVFQSAPTVREVLAPVLIEAASYGVLHGALKYAVAQDDQIHLEMILTKLHNGYPGNWETVCLTHFRTACEKRALACGRYLAPHVSPRLKQDVWEGFLESGRGDWLHGYIEIMQAWPAPEAVVQACHSTDGVPMAAELRNRRAAQQDAALLHLATSGLSGAEAWLHQVLARVSPHELPESRAYTQAQSRQRALGRLEARRSSPSARPRS